MHNCYEEAGQSSDSPGLGTVSGHDKYMYIQVGNGIIRLYPGTRQDHYIQVRDCTQLWPMRYKLPGVCHQEAGCGPELYRLGLCGIRYLVGL